MFIIFTTDLSRFLRNIDICALPIMAQHGKNGAPL
jgi:hypothetical protein